MLIDDAISTGATTVAAARLLARLDVDLAGTVVAMKQTRRWETPVHVLGTPLLVQGVYGRPLFRAGRDGWWPVAETQPAVP